MTQQNYESAIAQTEELLNHYGFELRGYTAQQLIGYWSKKYHPLWVRLAVVEALYQGRYKAVSVEQILNFWSRKGAPTFHFNHEFERLICRKLPRYLASFAYSSYGSKQHQEKLYLPASLSAEVDNFTAEKDSTISPENPTILEAVTQEFREEKQDKLALIAKQFKASSIDKFKPPSDHSNLYVKLKEALTVNG